MQSLIKRVCAWCDRFLGGDSRAVLVSHGICSRCAETAIRAVQRGPGKPTDWRNRIFGEDLDHLWVDLGGEG